jgi:peptidyl-prolyl cis-trans isomerase A (cyclophilin A)
MVLRLAIVLLLSGVAHADSSISTDAPSETHEALISVEIAGKPAGTLTCALFPKIAPQTVANFAGLARGTKQFKDPKTNEWTRRRFYDGLTFHRVIPDFVIQGGDPLGTGAGTPGYVIPDEPSSDLKFDRAGLLVMANRGPGTNGSQFYITDKAIPHLDNSRQTIFGECRPLDLISRIARVPRAANDRPDPPVTIRRIEIR